MAKPRRVRLVVLAVLLLLTSAATFYSMCAATPPGVADNSILPPRFCKLVALHKPLGKPEPGEWLAEHVETGQDYKQYVNSRPIRSSGRRRIIYVQPLGSFSASERKILDQTAEFLGIFFQLPVKVREALPLTIIPASARREHPRPGDIQILSTHVLNEVLKPQLPADAVVMIALTTADLWPGAGWNFVFGQASLADRVGVWSIHRFGDPEQGDDGFRLVLGRTLKTSAHETGHMFSLAHCIYYECCMNGSNHLEEADGQPLWLCPQCLAKLCYATAADPQKRFRELLAFAKAHTMPSQRDFWQKSLEALAQP